MITAPELFDGGVTEYKAGYIIEPVGGVTEYKAGYIIEPVDGETLN